MGAIVGGMKAQERLWIAAVVLTGWLAACVTTPSGRKAFIVTSEGEEKQLGEQAYREMLSQERLSTNSRWNAILQRVGSRIAAAANRPDYQWEFRLIESKQQNAFALPGGKVAFYTAILPVCETEAGIAVVMGHEVAHATARHGGERISTALVTQLGMAGIAAAMGQKDSTEKRMVLAALGVGATVGIMLPFSRSNESEADQIGLSYMARAGYDPREAPRFWSRFAKEGSPPEFLSTHPNSGNRQAALQAQLPQVLPDYERSPRFGLGEKL